MAAPELALMLLVLPEASEIGWAGSQQTLELLTAACMRVPYGLLVGWIHPLLRVKPKA